VQKKRRFSAGFKTTGVQNPNRRTTSVQTDGQTGVQKKWRFSGVF
jgi:hypothetical protein